MTLSFQPFPARRPLHARARGVTMEWYESFFTELALDFWRAAVPDASTAGEAEFLTRELGVLPPASLLDLPSGTGRHALLLARRGYHVTGVDLSPVAVAAAQNEANAGGSAASFVLGDMRDTPPGGPYDGAYCFGNSFGYLSRPEMPSFVRNIFHAVRPGGRWAIDTGAAAESLLPHLVEERTLEAGGVTYRVRSRYDAAAGRLVQSCSLTRGSETQLADISHAVYTVSELHRLLEGEGWRMKGSFGSLDGRPFAPGDRRLLLTAERPSTPP
jgi:SAM-dependent methyltransferase